MGIFMTGCPAINLKAKRHNELQYHKRQNTQPQHKKRLLYGISPKDSY